MTLEELLEFNTMLLIEFKCLDNDDFYDYVDRHCDINNVFNVRYSELLDKFLNKYALNKPEKSDKNISN